MGQHVLVINRFDSELGRYHAYIDHQANAVAYITTEAGAHPIDQEQAETVFTVEDLANWEDVIGRSHQIVHQFGAFDHVIALSEFDLELGARLREVLDVPGPTPDDIRRVRDKVTMKRLVSEAGLRAPRFIVVDSPGSVRRFVEGSGFPVVLKPRDGWDSQGVILVRSEHALDEVLATQALAGYECEEYVAGEMYHVDGLAQDGTVRVVRASRLLATCLDFALGTPFGSVSNDDADLERRLASYAQRVVNALQIGTSAFHLEVFRTPDAMPAVGAAPSEHDDLVFLEIGARVGGAQIPYIWRQVYRLDLVESWVRMLMGENPVLPRIDHAPAAGYLLMPEPPVRPCRVLGVTPLIQRIPGMYAELLPAPGKVLDGTGGCKETGGTYRFRAATSRQVERAIRRVVAEYRLDYEPLLPEEQGPPRAPERSGRVQALTLQ